MSFKVVLTPDFQKDTKRLVKKYPSPKADLIVLLEQLQEDPVFGTLIMDDVYKVRLAIKSKNRGKRGGARTIHFIYKSKKVEGINRVYLLTIYDKSEYDSVSNSKLEPLVESIREEIAGEEE